MVVSPQDIKHIKIMVINCISQKLFLYIKTILFQINIDTCLYVNYIVQRVSTIN